MSRGLTPIRFKFLSNLLALGVSIIGLDETSVAPIPVSIKILLVSVFINKQFINSLSNQ